MINSFAEYIALLDNQEHPASRRAIVEEISESVFLRAIQERPDLKSEIVMNKMVPLSILCHLAEDPDANVRYWAAKKRKLPMEYLEKLAHDPDDSVRREVAHHAKITKQILEILARDEEIDIAERAKKRLDENDYLESKSGD